MRTFLLSSVLFFLLFYPLYGQIGPRPAWVNEVAYDESNILEDNGGFQYLLFDTQQNIERQSSYLHLAIKVTNSEGIQSMSDISVDYDPTYQKMSFHNVTIWRNGEPINKLQPGVIKTIQRETSMERSLYDGSLSAIINLTDVRKDDIIEYSYSVKGFNPINKSNFSTSYVLQFTTPVNRIYARVVGRRGINMNYKLFNGADEPQVIENSVEKELVWDKEALDYSIYEIGTPSWHIDQRRVLISTYNSWEEVVNWALPLYDLSRSAIPDISKDLANSNSKEQRILSAIRKVQDDVRYLGFESGISAYMPHPPMEVYKQRFGDCKDKSLLLVALLRKEGVEAYPMLVNTESKGELINQLPTNTAFDHCVVSFKHNGKDYFVDPTISNQGGDIDEMVFPNYKLGLLVKPETKELIEIPDENKSSIFIKELITVDSVGGSAGLLIRTEYEGEQADDTRSYFSTNNHESIQRDYRDYYRNLYPDLELADNVKFLDYDRSTNNLVVVEEYYTIRNFWEEAEDGSYIYCQIHPIVLESNIDYSRSGNRKAPYFIGNPLDFEQITQIDLPQEWPVETYNEVISGEGFQYSNSIIGAGQTVSISHVYKRNKSFIPGDGVSDFLDKHDEIGDELTYYLTYDADLAKFKLSWLSILIATIATGFGIFFAYRTYVNYDPEPWRFAEHKRIGGWLILPAIGITLTPIRLVFEIFDFEYFHSRLWSNLGDLVENSTSLTLLVAAEIGYNFMYFIFTLLVLILFYQRRTSLPRMITILYIVGIIGPLLDITLVDLFAPELTSSADRNVTYTDITRSVFAAAIWIPYFNIAERVKSTFSVQRNTNMIEDFSRSAEAADSSE